MLGESERLLLYSSRRWSAQNNVVTPHAQSTTTQKPRNASLNHHLPKTFRKKVPSEIRETSQERHGVWNF